MAKQGMKCPDNDRHKNDLPPVPELQGKANPMIAAEETPMKAYHTEPYSK